MVQTRAQLRRAEQRAAALATFLCPTERFFPCFPNCPFSHLYLDNGNRAILPDNVRPLPAPLCLPHLTRNACIYRDAERCAGGFHPSFEEFQDLDGYIRRVYGPPRPLPGPIKRKIYYDINGVISDIKIIYPLEPPLPRLDPNFCGICLGGINGDYCLMENCDHFFCSPCIRGLLEEHQLPISCPYCRVNSARVLFSPEYIRNRDKKL